MLSQVAKVRNPDLAYFRQLDRGGMKGGHSVADRRYDGQELAELGIGGDATRNGLEAPPEHGSSRLVRRDHFASRLAPAGYKQCANHCYLPRSMA